MSTDLVQDVVKVERSELPAIVEVLPQAFNHDPIMQYFYSLQEATRLNQLRPLNQLIVEYCRLYDLNYIG